MRLDHLLSREPSLWGTVSALAVWLVCWLFSCACMCSLPALGGGCGCVFWVGHKKVIRADTLSGSRSTPCERPLPVWWWLPTQPAGFTGVGCVWWVVCDLYSGCEHICSVLFFVFCLVLLGIRWMPWHQELMKDVAACDMPRGAGERALLSEGVRMGEPNLGCAGLPSSERV